MACLTLVSRFLAYARCRLIPPGRPRTKIFSRKIRNNLRRNVSGTFQLQLRRRRQSSKADDQIRSRRNRWITWNHEVAARRDGFAGVRGGELWRQPAWEVESDYRTRRHCHTFLRAQF